MNCPSRKIVRLAAGSFLLSCNRKAATQSLSWPVTQGPSPEARPRQMPAQPREFWPAGPNRTSPEYYVWCDHQHSLSDGRLWLVAADAVRPQVQILTTNWT